jgi:hypothetical protein
MSELDNMLVSDWILGMYKTLKDEEVLQFLIYNALKGDLRGDLSTKFVEKYPHLKEQVLNQLYL